MENDLLLEFKAFINITDTEIDTELLSILKMAESFIYDYYNVAIFSKQLSEVIKPLYGINVIYTKRGLISDLTSITLNGEAVTIDSNFYFEGNQIIFSDDYILQTTDRIVVNYTVGYNDILLVPSSLKMGLFIIGKKIYNDKENNSDSYIQVSSGIKENVKFIDQIPVMADSILNTFRSYRL